MSISASDLKPGVLVGLFQLGAVAVALRDDPRVERLWSTVVDDSSDRVAPPPWEVPLEDLARNHLAEEARFGDMLQFVRGQIGYFARKAYLWRDSEGCFQAAPSSFRDGDRYVSVLDGVQRLIWELVGEIRSSAGLQDDAGCAYGVAVEQLIYPGSLEDYENMLALIHDCGGAWARLGHRVDGARSFASGPFDVPLMRTAYGLASQIPGLGVLERLNRRFLSSSHKAVPDGFRLIGDPHVDTSKVVTALASKRDTLRTEVYDGERWVEIKLWPDSLVIFPSGGFPKSQGIQPTRHRILLTNPRPGAPRPRRNITFGLNVVRVPPAA